jgi:hypothetical protein
MEPPAPLSCCIANRREQYGIAEVQEIFKGLKAQAELFALRLGPSLQPCPPLEESAAPRAQGERLE